jgi:hypothetical protein
VQHPDRKRPIEPQSPDWFRKAEIAPAPPAKRAAKKQTKD